MQIENINTEIVKYLPQLSIDERNRRWDIVREKMASRHIECLLVWGNDIFWSMGMANIRYMTQIASRHGGYLVFPLSGDPVVFNSPVHMNRPINGFAVSQNWVRDVRPNTGAEEVAKLIKSKWKNIKRIGVVGGINESTKDIRTYQDYKNFIAAMDGVQIIDGTSLLIEARMIKSEEELSFLEKSGAIALSTLKVMINESKPGVRENEVLAAMVHNQIASGAEAEIFNFLHSEPIEGSDKIRHLLHGVEQNISPTQRPLNKGDLVLTEMHTSYGGYLSAAEFSIFIGKAPEQLKRISEICIQCLDSALEKFKPGYTLAEVLEATRQPALKAGMDYLELGFHGHGLASPEFPAIVLKPGEGRVYDESMILQENMVFGTNIDVFDPEWKKDVGLMFGDTVIVKDKPKLLVNTPRYLPENY
ncbi:MAG: Xaa-Pro peptidase family protein [Bacillota bacterium]|nr:Xaa-Pro peptidase family protein [Bacillota bacterium]